MHNLKKKKQNSELTAKHLEIDFKNKELSKFGIYLADKGDFLKKIEQKLLDIKKDYSNEGIDDLLKDVQLRQQYQNELENFQSLY